MTYKPYLGAFSSSRYPSVALARISVSHYPTQLIFIFTPQKLSFFLTSPCQGRSDLSSLED